MNREETLKEGRLKEEGWREWRDEVGKSKRRVIKFIYTLKNIYYPNRKQLNNYVC